MNEEKNANLRDMLAGYLALARKAGKYWKRATALFLVVMAAGMFWVVKKQRVFRSEASAAVHDVGVSPTETRAPEEAQAEMKARLDQVYGSRANAGRVIDELGLYPWLRGKTSRLKIIESFQESMSYTVSGRDAFKLDFTYQNAEISQRTVQRLLALYTDSRREAGQMAARNDLASVDTALSGLETALEDQEGRLERFERSNHDMVEQVRLRRLGQLALRPGGMGAAGLAFVPMAAVGSEPGDSARTRRLRFRLAALQNRAAALQRSASAPASAPVVAAAPTGPVEESERLQTMRRTVQELRERLARLRTTYTDEYPDVQITVRRLGDAERDLAATLAQERGRSRGSATASAAPAAGVSAEQIRSQLVTIQREMDQTRSELAAAAREDRARPAPAVATAPARTGANAPAAPNARRAIAPVPPPSEPAVPSTALTSSQAGNDAAAEPDRPLGSLVEVEAAYERLTSELTTTRTRYQTLLTRKFELQALLDTVNTTGSDVLRIIDPPSLPVEPEPPGKTRLAAMVLAAAIVFALGLAGISGFIDSTVYEPADLQRWGELPELPPIPDLAEERPSGSFAAAGATPRAAAGNRHRA